MELAQGVLSVPLSQGLSGFRDTCQGEDVIELKANRGGRGCARCVFSEPRNIPTGDRPDAALRAPSDAVVRVVLACVCGSDLWY
jgi:hypothetical protein